MRNLWIFISKYNAFFLFTIFFVGSLILAVNNNSYQKASYLNSSNFFIGELYSRVNNLKNYLRLKETNDRLAAENALLRNQLKISYYNDSVKQVSVTDTMQKLQYTYISARVVNNSVNRKDNTITINRGTRHGIKRGMGVISSNGVVGIVKVAGEYYSTILSLLNSETSISATIAGSNAPGALVWGDNYNPFKAVLKDIPNHIVVKAGDKVVTTAYSSIFPPNYPVGRVLRINKNGGASFWDIDVRLYTDFATLDYVNVVNNLMAAEQLQTETSINE